MTRQTTSVKCAEQGCREYAHYEYETKREAREAFAWRQRNPYRCVRHSTPDEVISESSPARSATLTVRTDSYGKKHWHSEQRDVLGSSFAHGEGFRAFAEDFPEGTRLVITAALDIGVAAS